ncbi:hypothetical protein P167DRAFT_575284 [Morchella conica CCBAS932]|uniref:Uncharacterized protein n=1 Tax=Morchella conica CCBAS932 TaxID=1392247 RepID=A0A3N4KQE2_9PEZI|nr:hypothetical protein P167DRAFT_575284 [Morchella conica CCBAS932]
MDHPTLDWWQEMVRKREEEELASYVFADRLKLTSMSFSQHDNHLRNAAHYDKLLKNYALELSKAREIAPETLEGMKPLVPSSLAFVWLFFGYMLWSGGACVKLGLGG